MREQPLTDAQEALINKLKSACTDNRALLIVDAAMRYRNTLTPSGVIRSDKAKNEFLRLIDAVS